MIHLMPFNKTSIEGNAAVSIGMLKSSGTRMAGCHCNFFILTVCNLIIKTCVHSKKFTDIKDYEQLGVFLTMPAFWSCLNSAMIVLYSFYCLLYLHDSLIRTVVLVKNYCCQIDSYMIPNMDEWKKLDENTTLKLRKYCENKTLPQNAERLNIV